MNTQRIFISILISLLFTGGIFAQSSPPGSTSSYTLEDLYNRLISGAVGAQKTFTEPASAPGSDVMHSINELMAVAPKTESSNGAVAGEVANGKRFWGLVAGSWGLKTGTMPNIGAVILTPGASEQTISAGYHNGSGRVRGDADLKPENIKKGVTIFGVVGTLEVPASGLRIGDNHNGGIIFYLDATGMHGLIAATADEPGTYNWNDALVACVRKGSGWYLPTKDELNLMYQLRTTIGGFQSQKYWSATEQYSNAFYQYFEYGSQSPGIKTDLNYVRAVRAF